MTGDFRNRHELIDWKLITVKSMLCNAIDSVKQQQNCKNNNNNSRRWLKSIGNVTSHVKRQQNILEYSNNINNNSRITGHAAFYSACVLPFRVDLRTKKSKNNNIKWQLFEVDWNDICHDNFLFLCKQVFFVAVIVNWRLLVLRMISASFALDACLFNEL